MNRTNLKNYAPQARRDFIQAMTDRAAYYGLTATKTEPVVERGDVAVIAGRDHPRAVAKKRNKLEHRIKRHGFEQTMEAMAYTWFNRLVAIRFMELHGYLEHGYRVLSHPESKPAPEILEHAERVDLPGLKKDAVIDFKLAGNKENELYRLLLTAQCNVLHAAMPFLFEKIDDETELLLPDNLLHSDSLIRKLVGEIDEEDWQEVEIIGWMYQFYISEKKDEVIGKVVASEDIPAATQLFTPNWIVKYLVQNTLGRQWLATYPESALRQQMEYYIEPAEQTAEVQEQLKAITPNSLNPEELTLLDPACGSGHILVEAYELFKAIYQERGYRAKDIPALILQKNLFGLEIDDRAAQLAAFALMMKARADDRRIFDSETKPNIQAFQDSQEMNAADITHALNSPLTKDKLPKEYLFEEIEEEKAGLFSKKLLSEKGDVTQADIASLLELFEKAKTFGSLIQVPPKLAVKLPKMQKRLDEVLKHGDLMQASANVLRPLLHQARLLATQYDAVVANPPYMGGKAMNPAFKGFAKEYYPDSKSDAFALFMEASFHLASPTGFVGMITMQSWMFLSSYESLRSKLIERQSLICMAHLGSRGFDSIGGSVVQTTAYVSLNRQIHGSRAVFHRLLNGNTEADKANACKEAIRTKSSLLFHEAMPSHFKRLPGNPIAYWVGKATIDSFCNSPKVSDYFDVRTGMQTGDNSRFVRLWHEVEFTEINPPESNYPINPKKWFLYSKGGEFRKWYGNVEHVVFWESDGRAIKNCIVDGSLRSRVREMSNYFSRAASWTFVGSSNFGCRFKEPGIFFDVAGSCALERELKIEEVLSFFCSLVASRFLQTLNPTLNFQIQDISNLPFIQNLAATRLARLAIAIARRDWDYSENSVGFADFFLLDCNLSAVLTSQAWDKWNHRCAADFVELKRLEEENNQIWIKAYGLQDELSADVSDEQITLYRPDQEEDIKRLLSYAIGCMMGRYSLDKLGLIYAQSGNQRFDPNQYRTFRADDDAIIPLLETDWGIRDDATNRSVEFIGVAWPKEHLEENLKFVADSLGPTGSEQPRDTIRRYLSTGFYKHHLSMYKKRPIYWLFSSGKQRAFQCLVYLHRYHEGTLARMRTEYVSPLQGQIAARIEQLEGDKAKATSTSHRNKLQKEQTDLKKQQSELLIFEEKLKHAADQKINLDLDDGVKVNYGKFGDLLAEVKAITGGKDEE